MYVKCEWQIVHINENNPLIEHVYVLATMCMVECGTVISQFKLEKSEFLSTGDTYMKKEYLLCKVKLKLYPI